VTETPSESQTTTTSDGGPAEGTFAGTPTDTPDTDGAAQAAATNGDAEGVPVHSAAADEIADADKVDQAVNGDDAQGGGE
jgi:hypothetical protein